MKEDLDIQKETASSPEPSSPDFAVSSENNQLKESLLSRNRLSFFLVMTVVGLIPQYLMRGFEKAYLYFYTEWTTYPGDLWYCWNNYMKSGFPYPREYPAGLQLFYRVLFPLKNLWATYESYMFLMTVFLGLFAVLTTYLLFGIVSRTHKQHKKILWFWILAPSFLFYGLLNFEFLCAFTIILAYYFFIEEEYYLAASVLALGTSMKVFPIFLTPLFFFTAPRKFRLWSVVSFLVTWLAFNLPFIFQDWNAWSFPYVWQIQENYARSAQDGSLWWVVYQLFRWIESGTGIELARHVGKLSLLLFGGLYWYFLKKYWHLSLARKCAIVIILFILTDRIYSPQYNIYLLPFLVLVDYAVDFRYFYLAEIPNVIHVLFLFHLKYGTRIFSAFEGYNPYLMQTLVVLKYAALIALFIQNLRKPAVCDTDQVYRESLQSDISSPEAAAS